jgi:hypothetical protein
LLRSDFCIGPFTEGGQSRFDGGKGGRDPDKLFDVARSWVEIQEFGR